MTNQLNSDLRLGQVLHKAIKQFLAMENEDITGNFKGLWLKYQDWNLAYDLGEDWSLFKIIGWQLAAGFSKSYEMQGLTPILNENKISFFGDKTIVRQPDLIAQKKDNKIVVVDFKFGKDWTQADADMEQQLTEYAMMVSQALMEEPPVHVAICNLRKRTRTVEWIYSMRTAEQIREYSDAGVGREKEIDFNQPDEWQTSLDGIFT